MTDPVPMELVGVRLELPTKTPILLLRETGGTRYLPIWIGTNEATAIALALEGVEPQRPLTHDLLKLVTESLGATVDRVVVTELNDGTFFADLVMTAAAKRSYGLVATFGCHRSRRSHLVAGVRRPTGSR